MKENLGYTYLEEQTQIYVLHQVKFKVPDNAESSPPICRAVLVSETPQALASNEGKVYFSIDNNNIMMVEFALFENYKLWDAEVVNVKYNGLNKEYEILITVA